jgi:hypothetical protein
MAALSYTIEGCAHEERAFVLQCDNDATAPKIDLCSMTYGNSLSKSLTLSDGCQLG